MSLLWPNSGLMVMATHDFFFKISQKFVHSNDVMFEIKSDGAKSGELLISKGNIEWVSASNSVNKHRLSWEKFATLMESEGSRKKIKK